MIRITTIIGWICFALDAAFIIALLFMRDAGSDAAGRGLARGWGFILLPILLAAGGVLYWATKSNSTFAALTGTAMVTLPFLLMGYSKIKQMQESTRYYAMLAEHGKFADANLNAVAKTIDAGDTTVLKTLLQSYKSSNTTLDYAQRDQSGETLLGFAVTRALDYSATKDKTAALRILLQNGVPYAADAKKVGEDWSYDALAGGGDHTIEISEIALDAGANANQKSRYDNYPIIMNYQVSLPKLALLVKHGADVHAVNERGETTVFNMVSFKKFPEALFFLQQGVDPDIPSSNGTTVRAELEKGVQEYKSQQRPMEPGYEEFVAALNAHERKKQSGD